MAKAKKQNFIAAYFSNFGLRQICDFLMIIGAIVIFIGFFVQMIVMQIGLGIYILASVLAIVRSLMVIFSKINKRAPEYKSAIINLIIMGVILLLAVFGMIYSFYA